MARSDTNIQAEYRQKKENGLELAQYYVYLSLDKSYLNNHW